MLLIQKLSLTLLSIALVPVFLVASIFYLNAQSSLQDRELSQLAAIATIQKGRVENLIEQNRTLLSGYTNRAGLLSNISQYDQRPQPATQVLLEQSVTSLQAGDSALESVMILNPAGVTIAATQPALIGHPYARAAYVAQGRTRNDVTSYIVRDARGSLSIYLVGPFVQAGKLVGIAVVESNMDSFLALSADYTGLGASGETMLVKRDADGNGLDILPLRFDRGAALRQATARSDTQNPVMRSLARYEGTITKAQDYRGHTVLAATRYIPEAGWGLVVKIDQSETYGPLMQLGNVLLVVMFILSVVIVFVAFYLARRLNEPILALGVAADALRGGDLSARAQVTSRDEIGQLAETFNAMAENVERVDQMKSEFVLLTSHQLRTPATAVKGFLSMLLDNYVGKIPPKQRELIETAYTENDRQISVINSILDVARLEAGEMVLARAMRDVSKVIEASASGQASLLAKQGQTIAIIKPKQPVMLWVDAAKLQLVVDNLIHNATKYSPRGTKITVTLKPGRLATTITVQDQGIGIARHDLPRLFKRFSRIASPKTTNIQGAGLGLYLAQKLTLMHGGTIDVHSREGVGTRFVITLPTITKEDL